MSAAGGEAAAGPTSVDLLLFEIGGEVYGADAAQVLRIERPAEDAVRLPELGHLLRGGRALVFKTETGEGQLLVDAVLGVQGAPLQSLRKLPRAASLKPYSIGVWLGDERPVLLIDLVQTLQSQKPQGR